jgi:hypothetical protein
MSGCCCDGQSDPTVSEGLANEEVTVRADGRGAEARLSCLVPLHRGFDWLSERTPFICEPDADRAVQQIGSCLAYSAVAATHSGRQLVTRSRLPGSIL